MTSSPDERFLATLASALQEIGIDAIVVGGTAGSLNGAPIMTHDVDLLVRDTPTNRKKLRQLAVRLGGTGPLPISELTAGERIYGARVPIDILYDRITGNLNFASLKSRARSIPVGNALLRVAALADVIKSKTAANRPKDLIALPVLRNTLATRIAAGLDELRRNVRKVVTEHIVDPAPPPLRRGKPWKGPK